MKVFPHAELTGKVIEAAIRVHQELRPGLDEKLYERSLCIELAKMGIAFDQQSSFDVRYRGHFIGSLIPDLVVEDKIIVDPKCVDGFTDQHLSQMQGYLNITGFDVALLLNFKVWPLGKKRVLRLGYQSAPP